MTALSEDMFVLMSGQVSVAFAVFLRMSAFFALLPGFGESSIPARVKLAAAFAMTLVVLPAVLDKAGQITPILIIFTEIATGAAFGIFIRLFVLALQTAGSIAAQSTSLSQLFGGSASDPLPAIGNALVISGLALAVMSGLHVKAAHFFLMTYDLVPMGQFPGAEMIGEWGVARVGAAFALAFELATPFVILSVIYNLALGAINRAMPQLMVAFVGAPLITAGGLILLMLSAPFMLQSWMRALDSFILAPQSGVL